MTLDQRALAPAFGLELRGVDLRRPIDDARFAEIRAAVDAAGVVLIPGQLLDDAQQLAFTARFGPVEALELNPQRAPRRLALTDISNLDADGELLDPDAPGARFSRGNQLWHADMSFLSRGAAQSMLSAKEIAPDGGGTEWADMAAAHDALPAPRRAVLAELVVEHSVMFSRARIGYTDFTDDERRRFAPIAHPLVRTHPVTGRRFLYIGGHAGRVRGMAEAAGRALLDELLDFAVQDRFVYRHRWAVADLVIWDNRRTLHRGRPADPTLRRVMRRTAVSGDLEALADG